MEITRIEHAVEIGLGEVVFVKIKRKIALRRIAERIKVRYWDEVLFIILLMLVTVAVIDTISALIRRRLIGAT